MKNSILIFVVMLCSIVTAQTTIPAGPINGTWGLAGSPYLIEGQINIPAGETLNIEPGVVVEFQGHYKFLIYGILEAIATESDSITFTAANPTTGWHSLRFIDAADSSHLSYCIIQYGKATGAGEDTWGGGIYCNNSNPVISHSLIRWNHANEYDGGMGFYYGASPTISDCIIMENSSSYSEGGVGFITNCSGIMENCKIINNEADGRCGGLVCYDNCDLIFLNCEISGNAADNEGGVRLYNSSPLFADCEISNNISTESGGGMMLDGISNAMFYNCLINNNSAGTFAGGIKFESGTEASILNCIVSGNICITDGGGIHAGIGSSLTLINTIVEGNEANSGSAVYFHQPADTDIQYCDFGNYTGGDFGGDVPAGLGDITGFNLYGTPCDVFYNIFEDPLFALTGADPYALLENSPCIDAGIQDTTGLNLPLYDIIGNERIVDGRGDGFAFIDMGAYEFDPDPSNVDQYDIPLTDLQLRNYPNPFNPSTTISFNVPQTSSFVYLEIFNIKGQKIKNLSPSLCHPEFIEGRGGKQYSVIWNGKDDNNQQVSSGIYFYKLKTGDFEQTRKCLLIQ